VRSYDYARFLGVAVLWSLPFILMRILVPLYGSALVAETRSLFAAVVVVSAALAAGARIAPLAHWRDHVSLGITNNVLPFLSFSYAAIFLPAGYLAIMNGMVPLFTALFAAWKLGEPLGPRKFAGFLMGIAGVALIVNLGPVELSPGVVLAVGLGVVGAASWAYAGVQIKERSGALPSMGLAAGSTGVAALLMAPAWVSAPQAAWSVQSALYLVVLGAACSGAAYLAFFSLIRDIGPSRTMAVGYLVPVLGVAWGWLLLDETVTLGMLAGGFLVVAAMALILRGGTLQPIPQYNR
jgi:drug/metabolite transporter (DMT)-like permease